MKNTVLFYFLFLLMNSNLFCQPIYETKDTNQIVEDIKVYLLGNVSFGYGAKDIELQKVDAALNLAFLLTNKHYLVPMDIRDSVNTFLTKSGPAPTIAQIADSLKVDFIVFAHVNCMENMLRVDLTLVNAKNNIEKSVGEGYSLIHFMKSEDKQLIDPSLLTATQRALSVALNDSNLYQNSEKGFQTKPVPTLIVGGIEFIDNPQYLPKWVLFEKNILNSYDAVESIFEEARKSEEFVAYDIPTRDSIFALFNMFIVENHKPASYHEIEALEKFGVKYYVSGKFVRQSKHSEIELSLCEIKNTNLVVKKTFSEILTEDNILQFRAILKEITGKLLKPEKVK